MAAVFPVALALQLPRLPGAIRGLPDRVPDLEKFVAPGAVLTTSGADVVGRTTELPADLADAQS